MSLPMIKLIKEANLFHMLTLILFSTDWWNFSEFKLLDKLTENAREQDVPEAIINRKENNEYKESTVYGVNILRYNEKHR